MAQKFSCAHFPVSGPRRAKMTKLWIPIALLLLFLAASVYAKNGLDTAIYKSLKGSMACTRWLNTTGQIGCSTSSEGASGVFWPIENSANFEHFLLNKPKHSHLIVVLASDLFTSDLIEKLEKVKQVVGVAVMSHSENPLSATETSHFPQGEYNNLGENINYEWNKPHSDLIHREYKWPLWLLNEQDTNLVLENAKMNVEKNQRFGGRMTQFMFGYKDAKTCLHQGYCVPVGGHSVWGMLPPVKSEVVKDTHFVVTLSSLDALSLFSEAATGANADMSGLIANLGALTTLAGHDNLESNPPGYQAVDPSQFKKPILWAFFDAEHWGYPGSTRFLHDWKHFDCREWADEAHTACNAPRYPTLDFASLKLSNIDALVELRQVGALQTTTSAPGSPDKKKLFIHQQQHQFQSPMVQGIVELSLGLESTLFDASATTPGLPPSSSFSFLKADATEGTGLSAKTVVIADHDAHYVNKYYGSRLDQRFNIDEALITDAATVLARTLYTYAMEVVPSESKFITVNRSLVSIFVQCFTKNVNCELATAFLPGLQDAAPAHYHGPFFDYTLSYLSKFTHDYMIYISRNQSMDVKLQTCKTDTDCTEAPGPHTRCITSRCISSSYVQYHDSYSLGTNRNAKGEWEITDESLPNWVEPFWDTPTFDIFAVGNSLKDGFFLAWAIIQTILVVAGLYYFKKKFTAGWELM